MNFVYVDNSNVWIEGMHVSAVRRGFAPDIWTAQNEKICDYTWKIDFGRLYEFACGEASEVGRAVLFGSRPPANDSLWAIARSKGFEPIVYERNARNREKKIDTSIATEMVTDSFARMNPNSDEITLVAGDSDYVPTVLSLRNRGFSVNLMFWEHASRELKEVVSHFIPVDPYLGHLCLTQ
ncbi:MAG TPA: NYN domain-containing protein [Patescibacteria group bacterium]|nr:NYN domain-containing protein [Patescibacteria group bacterium]